MAQRVLIPKAEMAKLRKQGAATQAAEGANLGHKPVVKLFCPWGRAKWLISEIVEEGPGRTLMFGLCDLGMGEPELGYVVLEELTALKGPWGLKIEREQYSSFSQPLAAYAEQAQAAGRIVA
jgi:hypothetical protein